MKVRTLKSCSQLPIMKKTINTAKTHYSYKNDPLYEEFDIFDRIEMYDRNSFFDYFAYSRTKVLLYTYGMDVKLEEICFRCTFCSGLHTLRIIDSRIDAAEYLCLVSLEDRFCDDYYGLFMKKKVFKDKVKDITYVKLSDEFMHYLEHDMRLSIYDKLMQRLASC